MDFFEYAAAMAAQPQPQNALGSHRKNDMQTAIDASERVAPCKTVLQLQVLMALRAHGAMTDGELEKLPQFKEYGPSTVRKRRSELFQDGRVVATGGRRDGMNVWGIKV
jgi:hypothetical protein